MLDCLKGCECAGCYAEDAACACCCTCFGCQTTDRGIMRGRTSRVAYLVMFLLTTITAGVFRTTAPAYLEQNDIVSKTINCPEDQLGSTTCLARAFVMRMTFAHCVFHAILAIGSIKADNYSNPRVHIHTSLWPLKVAFWVGLHVASLFINSSFFLGFTWFALICACAFILVQIVMYIDWVYEINEWLIDKDGTDNITGPYHILILVASFFAFAAAVAMSAVAFIFFGTRTDGVDEGGGCELFHFFAAFNIVLFVLLILLSFKATSWMTATGMLPSTWVAAFMSFKVLSALYAQTKCNKISEAASGDQAGYLGPPEVVGAVAILIAIGLAAYNSLVVSGSLEAAQAKDSGDRGGQTSGASFGGGGEAVAVHREEARAEMGQGGGGGGSGGGMSPCRVQGGMFGSAPSPPAVPGQRSSGGGDPWVYRPPEPQREASGAGGGMYAPGAAIQAAGGGGGGGRPPILTDSVLGAPPAPASPQPAGGAGGGGGGDLRGPIGYSVSVFHLSFMLGMCFVAMQMTNWNEEFERDRVDVGTSSMWIKVADSWLLAVAFGWSMVAPLVFKGRDFENRDRARV